MPSKATRPGVKTDAASNSFLSQNKETDHHVSEVQLGLNHIFPLEHFVDLCKIICPFCDSLRITLRTVISL